MDIQKALTIASKDIRILFTDRNLLLIMIVAPLALTLIIGAAFSRFSGGSSDLPIENIPVAIVNEDQGASVFLQRLNYGDILTNILVPPAHKAPDPTNTLYKLIKAQKLSHDDAIAQVNQGKLIAAILIPPGFSESLNPTKDKPTQTQITLYRDAGSPIAASVVGSVVRGIVNNLTTGNIAIFAARDQVNAGKASPVLMTQAQAIAQAINDQSQKTAPITLSESTVTGQKQNNAAGFDPLQYFAPAMAIFFLTFTAAGGAGSLIEEQNNGTLQRLLSSPTGRTTILGGKLGGTYINGVLQITILIVAMALLGPLIGSKASVWGTNIPGIVLITLSAVAAATGLGTLIAGLSRTAQQSDVITNAVMILSGIAGGAFFNIATLGPAFQNVSKLTLNYWATNAYSTLAQTGDLSAVLPNIAVLLGMFAVFFGIGAALFNRRLKL